MALELDTSPRASLAWMLLFFFLVAPSPSHGAVSEGLPLLPVEGAEDTVRHRFDVLRKRILGRLGSPGVAADLYELRDLLQEGGALERGAEVLYKVAGSWRSHPDAKALARRLLADVERMRGRLPRMAMNLAAIGNIADVSVVGPFSNENREGWNTPFGPEKDPDLAASHEGLRSQVAWRQLPGLGSTGRIVLHEAVRPGGEILAYVLTNLEVPRDVQATLHLGSPGPTRVWLSGRPILNDPDTHPVRFDQRSVPLSLRRGSNFLLLKVASGESGPFAVEMRAVGANGAPIPGLVASAPSQGAYPLPRKSAAGLGRSPLVEELALAARSGSPQALEDWARVLGERHPFDEQAKTHARVAARAARARPERVETQLLAARFQEEDLNERRHFLERALAAERPGEALAHAALAQHWLSRDQGWKAVELLSSRLPQAPGDWPAHLLLARAWDAVGQPARARLLVEALVERHPDEPRLHLELAHHARRDGQVQEAARRWRVALALRPADAGAAYSLASALVDSGLPSQADDVLASVGRLLPVDVSIWSWRGELLAANGRLDEGRNLLRKALSVAPHDAAIWERMGEMELTHGQLDLALEAFHRSLSFMPQNARLRELIRSLGADASPHAAPFLRDLAAEGEKRETAFPGEDAVKLSEVQAVRVLPSGQASRTVQRIVHVRSQRGVDRFRTFRVGYAPGREELKVERARILRADGSIETGHSESEQSMNDAWSGIYYDARLRLISFPSLRQGDTVELLYRIDDIARDNLLSDYFGDLQMAQDTVPIVSWEYVLEMPPGKDIHANELEGARYEERVSASGKLHHWRVDDIPKLVAEPRMPGWTEVARHLHVSTYGDWDSVARYWWGLVRDQIEPTQEVERVAKEIVAKIPPTNVEARVQAIHGYVLAKTRYVGLELGIHSYKPYKVEQVLRRGFGDCKDKASLTHSLLRAVGIDSRLVLLRMRRLGEVAPWPASLAVFNHAILYVPSLDLYLDGTAEWSGSGELPEADRGAEILIVHPDGKGERGRTGEAPLALSTTSSHLRIELGADGTGTIEGESKISGLAAPAIRQAYASPNRRLASFERRWARTYPGAHAERLDVSDPRRLEEEVRLSFLLEVPTFAEAMSEGRLGIYPFGRSSAYLQSYAPLSSRRYDLLFGYPWTEHDLLEIALPEGAEVAELPASEEVTSQFGTFQVSYETREGRVRVERRMVLSSSRILPHEYQGFREFLSRIDSVVGRRVILSLPSELAVSR